MRGRGAEVEGVGDVVPASISFNVEGIVGIGGGIDGEIGNAAAFVPWPTPVAGWRWFILDVRTGTASRAMWMVGSLTR